MLSTDAYQSVRSRRREAQYFEKVRRAEISYALLLRKVGRHIGELVHSFVSSEDPDWLWRLEFSLRRYAEVLTPWARTVAARMIAEVARRDINAWNAYTKTIGVELKKEIQDTPIGQVMRQRLDAQIYLIKSLPLEAAQRVRNLATTGYASGRRAGEIRRLTASAFGPVEKSPEGLAKDILQTGQVTVARANLIARTEVTRTSTELTRARAEYVGSEGYIWRTAMDADVRKMHKRLEGTFHKWDDPPVAELNGERHHPGQFPNCRCWVEPVLPKHI